MFVLSRQGGALGRLIIERLAAVGQEAGILGISATAAPNQYPTGGVTAIPFDNARQLSRSLAYAKALILLPPGRGERHLDESRLIDMARSAGTRRVIRVSSAGADADSDVPSLASHGRIDEHLVASGLAHAIVRPHLQMQDLLLFAPAIAAGHPLPAPASAPAVPFVDVRDIADVVATLAQAPVLTGELWHLTGPKAWSFVEIGAAISEIVGHDIPCDAISAGAYQDALLRLGIDEQRAAGVAALLRSMGSAEPTRHVSRITGVAARALESFLKGQSKHFGVAQPAAPERIPELEQSLTW